MPQQVVRAYYLYYRLNYLAGEDRRSGTMLTLSILVHRNLLGQ